MSDAENTMVVWLRAIYAPDGEGHESWIIAGFGGRADMARKHRADRARTSASLREFMCAERDDDA